MADSSDELELDDFRPLAELRASLHNLYNYDIFAGLPSKPQALVVKHLSLYEMLSARTVCRTWNSVLLKHLRFWAELSDLSRYTFMKVPSVEPLIVEKVLLRKLTKLKDPFILSEILHNFRMRSPRDIRTLIVGNENAPEVIGKLLSAYCKQLEGLSFLLPTFRSFPPNVRFSALKRLEITTQKFDADPELVKNLFFKFRIPQLEELKLQIFIRHDVFLYMAAHFFASKHHKTLKKLSINFGYSLSDIDKFSKAELSPRGARDNARKETILTRTLEKDSHYQKLDSYFAALQLSQLDLNLCLNEGSPPWSLSLRLLNSCKSHLRTLTVQYPFVLRNDFNFSEVISQNAKYLEKISIPCVLDFDCGVLSRCIRLRSFSIGQEFSYKYLFFGNRGSLLNFQLFPPLLTLRSISVCVPLPKPNILWLSAAVPNVHSLLVYGVEKEFFSFREVVSIIQGRESFQKLMMRIYMKSEASSSLENYLRSGSPDALTLAEYFHDGDCGFTTFVVKRSFLHLLEAPSSRVGSAVNYEQSDDSALELQELHLNNGEEVADDIRDYGPLLDD